MEAACQRKQEARLSNAAENARPSLLQPPGALASGHRLGHPARSVAVQHLPHFSCAAGRALLRGKRTAWRIAPSFWALPLR
jgi:hypothetical protein